MSECRYCGGWTPGDVCYECIPKIERMRKGIPQGFNHTEAYVCPWCGCRGDDATDTWELLGPHDMEADVECPDCWKRFHLSVEVEYHFSTTPIGNEEAGS